MEPLDQLYIVNLQGPNNTKDTIEKIGDHSNNVLIKNVNKKKLNKARNHAISPPIEIPQNPKTPKPQNPYIQYKTGKFMK